jgi:hypothetical protein
MQVNQGGLTGLSLGPTIETTLLPKAAPYPGERLLTLNLRRHDEGESGLVSRFIDTYAQASTGGFWRPIARHATTVSPTKERLTSNQNLHYYGPDTLRLQVVADSPKRHVRNRLELITYPEPQQPGEHQVYLQYARLRKGQAPQSGLISISQE